MQINELQQAKKLILSKEKILLLTHQKMDADGLSSMLAFGVFLERLGKKVKIISTDKVSESFEFLPFIEKVSVSSSTVQDFVISIKTNGNEIDKLRYNTDGDKLNIVITPKTGSLSEDDISFNRGIGSYDLVICFDTGDLEYLGDVYLENTELFYSTPIINIDHHVTNTEFGQINLVDVTSSSSTMIVYDLIKQFSENWQEMIDEDLATLLMTGLITDTGSFQHNNTSPKTLELAADLMELGARQQDIIKNIYKTKHLSTLRLWGKILSKIQEDPIYRTVWSTATKEDLVDTGASLEDADLLIDELMTNAPGAEVVLLIKESFDGKIFVSLRSTAVTVDVTEIAAKFGGGGHKQAAGFRIESYQNFELEVGKIVSFVQDFQKKRLGISDSDLLELKKEVTNFQKPEFKSIPKEGEEVSLDFPKSLVVDENDNVKELEESDLPFLVEKKEGVKKEEKPVQTEKKVELKFEERKKVEGEIKTPKKEERQDQAQKKSEEKKQEEVKGQEQKSLKAQRQVKENQRQEKSSQEQMKKQNSKSQNQQQRQEKKQEKPIQNNKVSQDNYRQKQTETGKNSEGKKEQVQVQQSQKQEQKSQQTEKKVQETKTQEQKKSFQQVSQNQKQEKNQVQNQEQKKVEQNPEIERQNSSEQEQKPSQNQQQAPKQEQQKSVQQAQPQAQNQQQAEGAMVTKEQADQYARRFYELLQGVKPESEEYKKYYEGYLYYARVAGWDLGN